MATYNYILNINKDINLIQLHKDILQDTEIERELIGITRNDNNLEIEFDTFLNFTEETKLNEYVNNHNPIEIIPLKKSFSIVPKYNTIDSEDFKRVLSFISVKSIKYCFKVHSYKEIITSSYTIKIYDITNNRLILYKTLNNNEEGLIILGEANDFQDNSILEVSAKKTGHGKAFIESLVIYYS